MDGSFATNDAVGFIDVGIWSKDLRNHYSRVRKPLKRMYSRLSRTTIACCSQNIQIGDLILPLYKKRILQRLYRMMKILPSPNQSYLSDQAWTTEFPSKTVHPGHYLENNLPVARI
jgi:hypothetical protein